MSRNELVAKIEALNEWEAVIEEAKAEAEAIRDAIKAEMTARNVDTLTGDDWKITWKEVTSNRLDGTALKKALPDIAAAFTKASVSRRFTLA